MIPNIFYGYQSKEEKDLIVWLMQNESWWTKRNAILDSMGLSYFDLLHKKARIFLIGGTKLVSDNLDKTEKRIQTIKEGTK